MNINLEVAVKHIMLHGPNRVMISADEVTSSARARVEHGIIPDIIFIRDDGWSLAAPKHLEADAYKTWSDKWIGFMRKPATIATPIKDYGTNY